MNLPHTFSLLFTIGQFTHPTQTQPIPHSSRITYSRKFSIIFSEPILSSPALATQNLTGAFPTPHRCLSVEAWSFGSIAYTVRRRAGPMSSAYVTTKPYLKLTSLSDRLLPCGIQYISVPSVWILTFGESPLVLCVPCTTANLTPIPTLAQHACLRQHTARWCPFVKKVWADDPFIHKS